MPLYEFRCDSCGHRFEVIRKFSDPPVEICPKCGGPVQKLQSAPAFHLKGSGWYITDYGKKDAGPSEKTEGGAKKDGTGDSSAGDKKESPASKSSESSASTDSSSSASTTPAAKDSKSS